MNDPGNILRNPRNMLFLAAAVIVIGSFLPWASLRSAFVDVDKNGTEGDGVITLGMAVIIAVIAFLKKPNPGKRASWTSAGLGLLVGIIAIVDMADVNRLSDVPFAEVSIGIGLYVVAVGAVIALAGGLIKWPGEPLAEPEPNPPEITS